MHRNTNHMIDLLKGWCDQAVDEQGILHIMIITGPLMNFVYLKWVLYIRDFGAPTNRPESKRLIFEFLQDHVKEYHCLLEAYRYSDLVSELLDNVRWFGQPAYAGR